MNQKPYNKCLINLVCSALYGKVFAFRFFAHASLLRRSVLYKYFSQILSRTDRANEVNKPFILLVRQFTALTFTSN